MAPRHFRHDQPVRNFRYVRNADALLAHGNAELRRDALTILDRVLEDVNPFAFSRQAVRLGDGCLFVGDDLRLPLAASARIWFFGAGKASFQIARGVEEALGDRLAGGLVVCKEGQKGSLQRIDVQHARHPIPSEASVLAARAMLERAASVTAGDIVLCGMTGGSSALLTLPCTGLTLQDVQSLTETLLTCGADIFEINAVRKHLSDVGGGRLAQAFPSRSQLVNLTVSDVIGDALDYITDPTVPDTSTIADARATFDKYNLWERVSPNVKAFVDAGGGITETPKTLPWPEHQTITLLSSRSAVDAAQRAAEALGYRAIVLSSSFDGDSQALGQAFAAIAREIAFYGQPLRPPCAVIGGGETIVRMDGFAGLGGPNQEFALAGACQLPADRLAVMLGADTDGTDGPTKIAGALCDATTAARARELGIDIREALLRHNASLALVQLGDAVLTGPTETNVNDLKLMLLR